MTDGEPCAYWLTPDQLTRFMDLASRMDIQGLAVLIRSSQSVPVGDRRVDSVRMGDLFTAMQVWPSECIEIGNQGRGVPGTIRFKIEALSPPGGVAAVLLRLNQASPPR